MNPIEPTAVPPPDGRTGYGLKLIVLCLGWACAFALGIVLIDRERSRRGEERLYRQELAESTEEGHRERQRTLELTQRIERTEQVNRSRTESMLTEAELSARRLNAHRIRLADQLSRGRNTRREALDLLDEIPAKDRNWEWRHLKARFEGNLFSCYGHQDPQDHPVVQSVRFSPDGSRIASASDDGTIRIWSARTGEPIFVLEGPSRRDTRLAFSPDGSRLVFGSSGGQKAGVWDLNHGKYLFNLMWADSQFFAVEYSPEGNEIFTVSERKTKVNFLVIDSGCNRRAFRPHPISSSTSLTKPI